MGERKTHSAPPARPMTVRGGSLKRPFAAFGALVVDVAEDHGALDVSVRLAEIGRALEESIALAKTETRLSRNLGRPELRRRLEAAVVKQGSRRIGERTLLILDIADIAKPHTEKMECLAWVRDGSTGEIANGYWLCQGIGVENEGNDITPRYGAL